MMVTSLDKEFDVRCERDSPAEVIATLVYAETAGNWFGWCANTNVPEFVARYDWNHPRGGQQQLAIVETIASGCIRTEAFMLDKLVRRVHGEAPQSHDGTE